MGWFKRRRVRKFAEKTVEHQNEIFVFGSNIFTEAFIDNLIEIGAEGKVALISDKRLAWIEDVKSKINVLYEDKIEEYGKRNLYETIGFSQAKKVIILHEDPIIIQNIMSFISSDELKAILLAQFAPPFVHYLAGQKQGQILIVDNLFQIVRKLYEEMNLPLVKPPVIAIPVPKNLKSGTLMDLQIPKVKIINILREESNQRIFPLDEPIQENDKLLLYLEDSDTSLKSIVDFLGQNSASN
jgi:hypothetical protein